MRLHFLIGFESILLPTLRVTIFIDKGGYHINANSNDIFKASVSWVLIQSTERRVWSKQDRREIKETKINFCLINKN